MQPYEIVEIEELSGGNTTIYSVLLEGDELTSFDHFVKENIDAHPAAVKDIVTRLQTIGDKTGAREQFFKQHEGEPGDGVCALYDSEEHQLRLYCIRYGTVAIILGGGGKKGVRAWQEDDKLAEEARFMIQVSKDIMQRLKSGDIQWSEDSMHLLGDLYITNYEEET